MIFPDPPGQGLPSSWFADAWIAQQPLLDCYRQVLQLLQREKNRQALDMLLHDLADTRTPRTEELKARLLFTMGEKRAAEQTCSAALERFPHHAELVTLQGQFLMEQGNREQAMELFQTVAAADRPTDAALLNLPAPHTSAGAKSTGCVLLTSLPPGNIPRHQACVRSWRQQGFRILSLNAEQEARMLAPLYPDVEFVCSSRDASPEVGRPCVYIDDMLSLLALQPERVCGIVNADIELLAGPDFWACLVEQASSRFVFGSRLDVEHPEADAGRIYSVGFDYFFFPKAMCQELAAPGVAMGTPWWDYLLPFCALEKGHGLHRVLSPVAQHVRHHQNWGLALGWRNGIRVLQALMPEKAGLLLGGMDLEQHNEGYARLLGGLAMSLAETLATSSAPLLFAPGFAVAAPFDPRKTVYPFPTLLVNCAPAS